MATILLATGFSHTFGREIASTLQASNLSDGNPSDGLSSSNTDGRLCHHDLQVLWGRRTYPLTLDKKYLLESSTVSQRAHMRKDFDQFLQSGPCLEIGPKIAPILPRDHFNTRYLDHASAEELERKYGLTSGKVPKIHYVWKPGLAYTDLVNGTTFKLVVASHVVEHVLDLVGFLRDVASVMEKFGEFRLAIPDKRYCFDFRRGISTFSDVVGAYLTGGAPSASSIFEELYLVPPKVNSARRLWKGKEPIVQSYKNHLSALFTTRRILKGELEAAKLHRWQFVPGTFVQYIEWLHAMGLICFEVMDNSVVTTRRNSNEFLVFLRKVC